jgi:tetratricopeptide (TPR) repeat protein
MLAGKHFVPPKRKDMLTDVRYLQERGRLIDTNLYNNMAQSICESLKFQLYENSEASYCHGVTHAELGYTLAELYHNRGVIACGASDVSEALRNLKIFHDMMQKEFQEDTPRVDMRLGLACNELGFAYMLKEDWAQGEVYFLRSIELLQQLHNFEPILISLPLVNLGYAYWLQGRLDEAAAVLEKGVGDRETKYGIHDRISFM